MKIGIDRISFYTPDLYVDMHDLAEARNVDPGKFKIGIGQDEMAVSPITQDPVTLAANAALQILDDETREQIDFVMFGTETGIDHSKAAGVYVHGLLGINPEARTIELKQACYGATAAIQMAKGHIALNPKSKVLVLGSDIARYGINTPGEVTQGAGAVAVIISADPSILVLEDKDAFLTEDIMDFWRPTYSLTAYVDGKFSNEAYLGFFQKVWNQYKGKSNLTIEDFAAICFHMPYTKMGLKALQTILEEGTEATQERLQEKYQLSTQYSRKVGNIYTASLYLSFASLLDLDADLQAGDRIGLFSYGSGAVGEFFSGILQENYREHLVTATHEDLFAGRKRLSVVDYEAIFEESLPTDGSTVELDTTNDSANFVVTGITEHKRQYAKNK